VDIEDGANGTSGEIGKVFAGPWLDRQAAPAALTPLLEFPFLIQPAPGLLNHQARHRATSAALISEAVDLLARHVADEVMTW
jgi:hypothetical protein